MAHRKLDTVLCEGNRDPTTASAACKWLTHTSVRTRWEGARLTGCCMQSDARTVPAAFALTHEPRAEATDGGEAGRDRFRI